MNILVFRFSAMGDVALTVPVIKTVLKSNPQTSITIVSKPGFDILFDNIPGCTYVGADFKHDFNGFRGLNKLHHQLHTAQKFDVIIDLHDVLRSWILCRLATSKGITFHRIDKGRKEKKQLTRKKSKSLKPLKHTTQRYLDVFEAAGLKTGPLEIPAISYSDSNTKTWQQIFSDRKLFPKTTSWIGIAPFSKHAQKEWPLDKMEALIGLINQAGYKVVLFGGGKREIKKLEAVATAFPDIINVAGKLNLADEINLIDHLDLMLTMDSFNMHLASLVGCKVISIWGATHPYSGFSPPGDNQDHIIQVDTSDLNCRPCSVFGNKPCWRGDLACLQQIKVNTVFDKINDLLKNMDKEATV